MACVAVREYMLVIWCWCHAGCILLMMVLTGRRRAIGSVWLTHRRRIRRPNQDYLSTVTVMPLTLSCSPAGLRYWSQSVWYRTVCRSCVRQGRRAADQPKHVQMLSVAWVTGDDDDVLGHYTSDGDIVLRTMAAQMECCVVPRIVQGMRVTSFVFQGS